MNGSPILSVPRCTRTVATGPRERSSRDSRTTPDARDEGSDFRSSMSADRRIISRRSSIPVFCLAETCTDTTSPPQSSTRRPWSASCFFTRSRLAPGLSILLIATTIGTPAARAWCMASVVWGITPSSAATTRITRAQVGGHGLPGLLDRHFFLERDDLRVEAELAAHLPGDVDIEGLVDRGHDASPQESRDDVLGLAVHLLGKLLDRHPLGDRD